MRQWERHGLWSKITLCDCVVCLIMFRFAEKKVCHRPLKPSYSRRLKNYLLTSGTGDTYLHCNLLSSKAVISVINYRPFRYIKWIFRLVEVCRSRWDFYFRFELYPTRGFHGSRAQDLTKTRPRVLLSWLAENLAEISQFGVWRDFLLLGKFPSNKNWIFKFF